MPTASAFAATVTQEEPSWWAPDAGAAWSNPTNAQGGNDAACASVVLDDSGQHSYTLVCSGFDFSSVPVGHTISTLEVKVRYRESVDASLYDALTAVLIGPSPWTLDVPGPGPLGSYGGLGATVDTDLVVNTFDVANPQVADFFADVSIKDAGFAVGLYAEFYHAGNSLTFYIDSVELTATYTGGGGAAIDCSFAITLPAVEMAARAKRISYVSKWVPVYVDGVGDKFIPVYDDGAGGKYIPVYNDP